MAKPVTLTNGRSWNTQGQAEEHFRAMLRRYADEQVVDNAQDHEDLVALLERYDDAINESPSKTGCGINYFFRRRNKGEGWSSASFWVRRLDGTETDFSFISAVKGVPRSPGADFYQACRTAVEVDLVAAKKRFFQEHPEKDEHGFVPCELTGNRMCFDTAHVDHAYPTFNQIVLAFRAARGWTHGIPAGVITPPMDAQARATFVDPAVADAFRALHHGMAILRIIDATANLSMASSQRIPKIKYPVTV